MADEANRGADDDGRNEQDQAEENVRKGRAHMIHCRIAEANSPRPVDFR